jgi:Protein of unknown function (DUF1236)
LSFSAAYFLPCHLLSLPAARREYVRKEKKLSTKVMENVAVGTILPSSVALYPLPADLGVKRDYRYSVVNEHTVLVEAKTR